MVTPGGTTVGSDDPGPHRRSLTPRRRGLATLAALAAASALLGTLALAPAALAKPTGEFEVFSDCPLATKGVNQCVYMQFSGGEVALGGLRYPIVKTITLQGGLIVVESPPSETFVGAADGNTLSKTAEVVPGGLTGLGSEPSELTVTLELVGSVALSRTKLAAGEGTALTLPVRAHLKNVYLGEACYIGSSTKPITLNLTTGTTSPPAPNKPIKGSPGERESKDEGKLVVYKNDKLVENAFSVPGASGCGGIEESLIDPILNSKFSLPAAAGHSTAIFGGTSKFASAEAVRESE